jgi:ABC-type transport system involved in multi-copper enzyme maturation permease subunit
MPISERGYVHWQGTFVERRFPWWPIARRGIRQALKRKLFIFSYLFSLLPMVVPLTMIYISEHFEDFQSIFRGRRGGPTQVLTAIQASPEKFKDYFTSWFILLLIIIALIPSGAWLMTDDLKNNSLQLYFSRPLRRRDYFLGKISTVLFFLLTMTLVPGLLFIIAKLVLSGSFKFLTDYPWLPLSVIACSFLFSIFFAFYTLLVSCLSRSRLFVSIFMILIYILSDICFGIFYLSFRSPYFALFSIHGNLQQIGAFLFRVRPLYNVPWFYSLIILTAVCGLSGFVLTKKIRSVEVIR